MSRRAHRGRATAGVPPADRRAVDPSWTTLGVACATLFLARFWLPAETADEGETLWVVVGWLGLAAMTAWVARRESRFAWRPGWPEIGVGVLVLAQCGSALSVRFTGGDQRAATNMQWEWVGVGVAFVLLRCWAAGEPERRRLAAVLLAVGLLLAGLGVWQRFVWYPSIQSDYREWEQLQSGAQGRTPEVNQRLDALRERLGPELLAMQGPSQAALRQRVLDSVEPFARFGLANTFAGVLAVVLVLLCGCRPRGGWAGRLVFITAMSLLAGVLVLTRSRTAWLAAVCGVTFFLSAQRAAVNGGSRWRAIAPKLLVGFLALLPLAAIAHVAGAIDPQELVEAPKSVLYRLQYWSATWPVIGDHPWLGVGPGNFRQHYLQYKLPEASEEISDPHNLVLDVWASGGVLALVGLLIVLGLAARRWMDALRGAGASASPAHNQRVDTPRSGGADAATRELSWSWLCVVGWLSFGLVYFVTYVCAFRSDSQLVWLAVGWLPAAWLATRLVSSASPAVLATASVAASLTLVVHLLTSGGIAMPVVTLLLLVTAFVLPGERRERGAAPLSGGCEPPDSTQLAERPVTSSHDCTSVVPTNHSTAWPRIAALQSLLDRWQTSHNRHPARTAATLTLVNSALLLLCLLTGWLPVTLGSVHLASGSAVLAEGRPEAAVDAFLRATVADPANPRAWRELAFAETVLWQRRTEGSEARFTAAIAAAEQAIIADRQSPHAYRFLADLQARRARQTGATSDAEQAVAALEQALDRYPHSAWLHADLARALTLAGRLTEAPPPARRALELDDLFRAAGHWDKTFTTADREELTELATP